MRLTEAEVDIMMRNIDMMRGDPGVTGADPEIDIERSLIILIDWRMIEIQIEAEIVTEVETVDIVIEIEIGAKRGIEIGAEIEIGQLRGDSKRKEMINMRRERENTKMILEITEETEMILERGEEMITETVKEMITENHLETLKVNTIKDMANIKTTSLTNITNIISISKTKQRNLLETCLKPMI